MKQVVQTLIHLHARSPHIGALLAALITVIFAFSIDMLVIEGSSIEDMTEGNPYVEVERSISRLNGDRVLVTLIVEPSETTISDVMSDLERIKSAFDDRFQTGEFRSVLYMKDQLFLYDLEGSDAIEKLLYAVSTEPKKSHLVSKDAGKFLILLWVPKILDDRSQFQFLDQLKLEHIKTIKPLSELHLRWDTEKGIERDLGILIPAVAVVVLVVASIGFGNVGASALLALMLAIGGTLIVSLFSLFSVPVNLVTLLAIPIVLVLSLASVFHLLAFVTEYGDGSLEQSSIVEKTLQRLLVPLTWSTATTVVALATFGFSPIKPIAQLGLLSALALLLMLLITLLLAPLGLRWVLWASRKTTGRLKIIVALSGLLRRNRKAISIGLLALMLASAVSIPFLSMESDPDIFFPKNTAFTDTYLEFERDFGSYAIINMLLQPKGANWVVEQYQSMYADVLAIKDEIEALDGISRVTIDARTTVSVFEAGQIETATYLIIVFVEDKGDTVRVARDISNIFEPFRVDFDAGVTSPLLVYNYFDRQVSSSLFRALSVSFLVVFGIFYLLFRSWKVVLAALAANAVPIAMLCGLIWALGTPINILTAFVFLIVLGVVVDDTIHILYHRSKQSVLAGSSIEYSVLLTTGASCCGFALCYLSNFEGIRQFAGFSAIAFALAVISDLTVLPYLLRNHVPSPGAGEMNHSEKQNI